MNDYVMLDDKDNEAKEGQPRPTQAVRYYWLAWVLLLGAWAAIGFHFYTVYVEGKTGQTGYADALEEVEARIVALEDRLSSENTPEVLAVNVLPDTLPDEGGEGRDTLTIDAATQSDVLALSQRIAQLEGLTERVDDIEGKTGKNSEFITQYENKGILLPAMIEALRLRQKVFEGDVYIQHLELISKQLNAYPDLLNTASALAAHANTGVATVEGLARQLTQLADAMDKQVLSNEDGMVATAKKLLSNVVSIRNVNDMKGDDIDAVILRAEYALAREDIAAALLEMGNLPEAHVEYFDPWLKEASNVMTARRASRDLIEALTTSMQTHESN